MIGLEFSSAWRDEGFVLTGEIRVVTEIRVFAFKRNIISFSIIMSFPRDVVTE